MEDEAKTFWFELNSIRHTLITAVIYDTDRINMFDLLFVDFLMMKEKLDNFIFYVSFISLHRIATHMPQCQFSSQNWLDISNSSYSSKMIYYCFVSFQWTFKYNIIIIFVYAFDVWRSMFLFLHIFFRSFAFFALILCKTKRDLKMISKIKT